MPFQRRLRLTFLFALLLTTLPTRAGTYTDTLGDNWGPAEADLQSAVVSDDMQNITFHLNLNSAADLTANYFPDYEVGIQVRKGTGGPRSAPPRRSPRCQTAILQSNFRSR